FISTAFLPSRITLIFPYTTLFRSVLEFDAHRKRSDLAVRHVIGDGLDVIQRAMFDPDFGRALGLFAVLLHVRPRYGADETIDIRSEEHTSELQSRENLVCRLLLEK